MIIRNIIYGFFALVMCLASCRRIDLHESTSSIYLDIQTDYNPNIKVVEYMNMDAFPSLQEKLCGSVVQLYHVCFYDKEYHDLIEDTYVSRNGGFLNVPPGNYDMIIYSVGSDVTLIKNTAGRSMTLACTSVGTWDGMAMINEPEHIFVAVQEDVIIPVYSDSEELRIFPVKTEKVLDSYSFKIANVEGIEKIHDVEMYVSGQFQGIYLWDRRKQDRMCQVRVEPVVDVNDKSIYTVFNTFGRIEQSPVEINLIVTDKNGRKFRWKIDVTEILDDPDNEYNSIFLDNILIIPDTSQGDGFVPEVDEWDDEITYVPIS